MLLLRNQLLPNDLLPLEYSSCRSGSHMALQFKPVSKKKTLETVLNTRFGTNYAYFIDERWETVNWWVRATLTWIGVYLSCITHFIYVHIPVANIHR